MTFAETLISEGYVFDDEDYDGCYVKQDPDGIIHCYQEGEMKMIGTMFNSHLHLMFLKNTQFLFLILHNDFNLFYFW